MLVRAVLQVRARVRVRVRVRVSHTEARDAAREQVPAWEIQGRYRGDIGEI